MNIKIKRMNDNVIIPTYGTKDSACVDLYAIEEVFFNPGDLKVVRSGFSMEIPEGYYAEVFNRSGLASKQQLVIVSSRIIDSDYRGELMCPIKNIGYEQKFIKVGERYAQMLIKKRIYITFEEVDELTPTERGGGGFGSTGR